MSTTATPSAKDNLLGICHAIGEDFGFNPLWLRLVLAAGIVWNAEIVVAVYLGLGIPVLVSRLLTRRPAAKRPAATVVALPARGEPEPLRQAA